MFPIRIGLASRSATVGLPDLTKVANAINLQVTRDFGPIWNVNATVVALPNPDAVPPGIWPVFILDQIEVKGALGFHLTNANQPFANVLAGSTWSLTAGHEVLEMLADPSGNRLVSSTSIQIVDDKIVDGDAKFEFLVEVCDPSEDAANAYLVDDVLVPDFYTPRYFDPVGAPSVRYSFSGNITRPRQLLPNGYLSWVDPTTQTMHQARAFGAPEIVQLPTAALAPAGEPASSLRGFVDKHTIAPVKLSRVPSGLTIMSKRQSRADFLAKANLVRGATFIAAAGEDVGALGMVAAAAPEARPTLDAATIAQLARPGVIRVRLGKKLVGDWPSDQLAYVVIARPEAIDGLRGTLPAMIGSTPVDLRPASPIDLLAVDQPLDYAVMADARHELRRPAFPDEMAIDAAGAPLAAEQLPLALLEARKPAKEHIEPSGPAGFNLDPITDDFSLILHASPEAGWAQLSAFLQAATPNLVVGMYDFTSAHILDALEAALAAGSLTLTLDHPAPNPSSDQTDEETVQSLKEKVPHLSTAWALTNSDPKAAAWIYPNAYHIKVAVRDDGVMWLSSGNWNNSNQPEIDLDDHAAAIKIAKNSDRDWHVIADNAKLADVFRAYLKHDFEVATQHQAADVPAALAAFAAAGLPTTTDIQVPIDALAAARTFQTFFEPKTVSGNFTVQPLLTPDNYITHVLPLIQGAQKSFYMQTQYIHPGPGDDDAQHNALIAAVQALIARNIDVRLICSTFETADWLEKLKDAGLDLDALRVQPRVHNKGIIVDSEIVMVSSQNWSADGTLRNRDAGLIIHNPEAAAYFEQIFLHDWNNLAAQHAAA
jgi:hypothetical protein